jgi:alpha/beta hydrolase family protein
MYRLIPLQIPRRKSKYQIRRGFPKLCHQIIGRRRYIARLARSACASTLSRSPPLYPYQFRSKAHISKRRIEKPRLPTKKGLPMATLRIALLSFVLVCCAFASASADPLLADFDYPYPVQRFEFRSQGQLLSMAYMDVRPVQANGKTIVMLHGKNFCGATWGGVIGPLRDAGYRTIALDQIGFCKSTKPQAYQFGLHQLAANTRALLASIGVERPIILGHSMGGMLALRYALMYPSDISALVVVNPIGLEDWKAKGVPFATVDQLYERELKTSFDTIKRYQQAPTTVANGSLSTISGCRCWPVCTLARAASS